MESSFIAICLYKSSRAFSWAARDRTSLHETTPPESTQHPKGSKTPLFLRFAQINTNPPGTPRLIYWEGSPCSNQRKVPLRTFCSSGGGGSVSHATETCDEPLRCLHLAGFLLRLLFLRQGNEQFLNPPPPAAVRRAGISRHLSFLSCRSQAHSDFVPGRNRRFSNSNYASKQPSPSAGQAG